MHYRQLGNSKSGNPQKTIVASPILFAVRHNLPMKWVKLSADCCFADSLIISWGSTKQKNLPTKTAGPPWYCNGRPISLTG